MDILKKYATLEPEFDLQSAIPGSFRQRRKAGLAQLSKQFFPQGTDMPGKFYTDITMVAYRNDDNSCTLIDGKLIKKLSNVAQLFYNYLISNPFRKSQKAAPS